MRQFDDDRDESQRSGELAEEFGAPADPGPASGTSASPPSVAAADADGIEDSNARVLSEASERSEASEPSEPAKLSGPSGAGGTWRFSALVDFFWTAVAVPVVSLVAFFLASVVMMLVAYAVVNGQIDRRMFSDQEAMRTVSESRIGLLLLVLAPQLALVIPALIAAAFSSVRFRTRLSLVRGHWPLWAWAAAALATPLIGWISSIAVGTLMDESENLKVMSDIFRDHGQTGFLIPLAILIGATPAFCEELLFRGFVQTRLGRRFGALIGILISSALFAVFHMDWVHIIAVFPLGVYLGTITWRSGSLFPAMLAHFVNNAISVFAVVLAPEQQDQMPSLEMGLFLLVILSTSLTGAIVTAVAFWRLPVPSQPLAGASEPVIR